MKTLYIADDGAEFSSLQECQKHEKNLNTMHNHFPLCWDEEMKSINGDIEDIFRKAEFMRIANEKELEAIKIFAETYNYNADGVNEIGVYCFNSGDLEWVNFEDKVERLNDFLKTMKEA